MSAKLQLTAKLDQRLSMNQQLRQAITLLQYNTLELKQILQSQLEHNPLLEIEEKNPDEVDTHTVSETVHFRELSTSSSYKKSPTHFELDQDLQENFSKTKTLRDHLFEQTLLCRFTHDQQIVAEAIIDSLDEHGRLNIALQDIPLPPDCAISLDEVQGVFHTIRGFDPLGVAAVNLADCLMLQLEAISAAHPALDIAKKIVSQCMNHKINFNAKNVSSKLKISIEEFNLGMQCIRRLNPYPCNQFLTLDEYRVEPELIVKKLHGQWKAFLLEGLFTDLRINRHYKQMIKMSRRHHSYSALQKELHEAQCLVNGLKRRNETLLKTAEYIVQAQAPFFERGHVALKPMNIAEVAAALSLHESTISRITTGKYISTPHGVFELKFFFPSQVRTASGGCCSATTVKEIIKELIRHETPAHIYSDDEIALHLQKKGIQVARRTIAKYREAMHIPASYQRVGNTRLFEAEHDDESLVLKV